MKEENDKLKAELEAVKKRGSAILESGTKMADEVRRLRAQVVEERAAVRDILDRLVGVFCDLKDHLDTRNELQNIPELLRGRIDLVHAHARKLLKDWREAEKAEPGKEQ